VKRKYISISIFAVIFSLATFFRLYGVNWDQGQHLHPDERFLTMVTTGISWPENIFEYLDSSTSPLNPHNRGFGFFVYGTFPIFFTKYIADLLKMDDYGNLTFIGRQLSAFIDLGTVLLVYLIAKQINPNLGTRNSEQSQNSNDLNSKRFELLNLFRISDFGFRIFPYIAMFLYSCMVLPIQLSHFYAVDTYLTFFITLSFYLLIRIINYKFILNSKFIILNSILGISFGLAIASKISAIIFTPILLLGFGYILYKYKNLKFAFSLGIIFILSVYFTLRLFLPYLFAQADLLNPSLNPKVLDNWKQLKSFDGPDTSFPPALQWIPTKPYIYPFTHLIFWGLGLPLGILSVTALIYCIVYIAKTIHKKTKNILRNDVFTLILIILFIIMLFVYQAGQFAKASRYLYPFYPFLALLSGLFVNNFIIFFHKRVTKHIYLYFIFALILFLAYPFSFFSTYSRLHSRQQASLWIYKNILPNATIATEHWDDGLPLFLPNGDPRIYKGVQLALYDPDSPQKWEKVGQELEKTDYIILTSNRLWRSLSALPQKYPQTSKYYRALFDGSLGFQQIAVFSSYPCLIPKLSENQYIPPETTALEPPPISFTTTPYCTLALNDDGAEESFTVYDHPKVIIFEKTGQYSFKKLKSLIGLSY